MNIYDWLDNEFNNSILSSTGFTQLIATKPCIISSSECLNAGNRLKVIHDFQDRCIRLFRYALRENDEELLNWLINETPSSLGVDYHKKLLDWHFTRPVFFRTDEMQFGKIAEIQCPGSHWGELELLYRFFKRMGSTSTLTAPSVLFTKQLKEYLGDIQPIVHYLVDNASAPTGVRYFISKTRPTIKYWGIDSGVSLLDCNFIRSHSFFGLCAENYFKIRLKESQPTFKYDFPPYVLFDQKATLVLPFWSKTRKFFNDEIRNLIIYSTPLLSETIELENGENVTIRDFSNRLPSQRAYYLKYAGSDVSMNWGSRTVYRLSNETAQSCEKLLQKCLNGAQNGQSWLLQKEVVSKCEPEYWDRTGSKKVEKMHVKYSAFYGPFDLIGMSSYYRKHFKVHGQNDTVQSLVVPEGNGEM